MKNFNALLNRKWKGLVVAVLEDTEGNKRIIETKNLVTTAGDIYYAQKACGETPTNAFANCVLGSAAVAPAKTSTYDNITPIAGSNKAKSTGYPKSNDLDADNTGKAADAITWKFEWAAADFNHTAITEGVITIAAPGAGSPVLSHFQFTSFAKASTDTLKLYVNHTVEGV
jgi:hypothetical protein